MSILLNERKAIEFAIGAALIILGVILKNSSEQMSMDDGNMRQMGGMVAFVAGWLWVAWVVSQEKPEWLMCVIPPLMIMGVVMFMKNEMKAGRTPPVWAPALFVVGWVWFSLNVSGTTNMKRLGAGLAVPAMVVASMMWLLPDAREQKLTASFGYPLFTTAWATLAVLHASK